MIERPLSFKRIDGTRIALDVYDICKVEELNTSNTVITFMATDSAESFETTESFERVMDLIAAAKKRGRKPTEGDEWKYGDDEE